MLLHSCPATVRKYLAIPEDEIPDSRATARERQHQLAMQQKQQEVNEARKLAPYEKDVTEPRSKGLTYPQIHKILCEKGYTGSVASLRMFIQKERTRMHGQEEQNKSQSEFIQRKSLCQLIYKKLENVATITSNQYEQALKKYPLLSGLYSLVKEFHTVMFSKKTEKLDIWIESAKKHNIPELQSFVEGILKDLKAIKNGIIYSYNNGLAEGSVNKIKVIKRIMYERNSLALLKSKVLSLMNFSTLNSTNNGKNL